KVTWVPDDLLTKFNYDMGSNLSSSSTHPNGVVFQYSGSTQKYVIEDGKKRALSEAAFTANRYRAVDVLTLDTDETYADGTSITGVESGILTPGWLGVTPATTALTASLYNSPASTTIPNKATNVSILRFKLTAGSSATSVAGLTFKRTDLGATTDWNTLYVYEGNDCLTPTGRSLTSDDHLVEFTALGLSIAANTSKTIELRGDLKTAGATANSRHAFQLTAVDTSATVSGLPLTGNVMVVGSVNVTTAVLSAGTAPINPSVGAQAVEIAAFKIQANGDNDLTFSQAVFTFTGTISRSDITNINLYLLGETTSLASVSSISSNDTFTLTLASPYVITKGQTKNFTMKADLAGEVGRTLKMYIEETYHLAVSDNQYDFGAAITNTFDTTQGTTLTLQGGEITMTDNGPIANEIAQNQQDVVLTKVAITSERNVEVRKMFVTLAGTVATANPTDGISDLRIKDEDTGQTLMTTTAVPTTATTINKDYLMAGTFNLTAGVTRNLTITVDVGVDAGNALNALYLSADLKIVDRSNDTVATNATDEEAQIRDVATGDWVLVADIIPYTISGENMTVQTPALTMAAASTPVSGLTVVKGATKVDGIGIIFTAGDASAISIRQFAVRVYVNSANTFLSGGEDASPTGEVTTVYLYDGDTLLKSKSISITAATHDYGAATFDGLSVSVPAGSTKKLVVKYDVNASLASAVYVAVGVEESTVTAYDSEGDTVTVTDNHVNYYTDNTSVPTHYTYLKTGGALAMAQDASTPDSAIVIAGASDVVMSKIKFTATNEDWTVNKLRVELPITANESSISTVKISYVSGASTITTSGPLAGGYVKFTNLNWLIEKDTEKILTISVDLADINPNIATTGRDLKIGLDCSLATDDCEAVGSSSTILGAVNADLSDVDGKSMYLRKSMPTVAAATAETALSSKSDAIVHAFTVTASSSGPITVKKFKWDVNIGDIDAGGELKVDNWKIYKSGSATALAGLWSNGTTTSTTGVTPQLSSSGYVIVELDSEVEIAANETKTFTLKAKVQGVEVNDSLGISLDADGDTTNLTGGLISHDTEGVKLYDGATQSSVEFLWSDKARGVNHAATMQSTYLDWSNGYLLTIFPVSNNMSQ
ncbi:hypothetical protein KKG58_03430, partial [Patescibacteria group bacterium]|nr:hypothetical protein [Patescibacteria group bacterium]